jgi:osmoprotectant transport system permease protein
VTVLDDRTTTATGVPPDRLPTSAAPAGGRPVRRWRQYAVTPAVLAAVLAVTAFYVSRRELDSIEQRLLSVGTVRSHLLEHLELTVVSTVLVLAIALPLGVLLTRRTVRWAAPAVLAVANIGQAAPAIGLIVLLAVFFGVGFPVAVASLVAYAVLPVLRNTIVGLQQVDRSLVEAGRGMGMSAAAVLFKVELPLAVPVILAGVRVALVLNVGVGALATFVNAGGLGDLINTGIKLQRYSVLVVGAVLTACLALLVDWIAGIVEERVRPKGMR